MTRMRSPRYAARTARLLTAAGLLPLLVAGQQSDSIPQLTNQLEEVRRQLTATGALAMAPRQVGELLERRKTLLLKLMEADPSQAAAAALPAHLAGQLREIAPESAI